MWSGVWQAGLRAARRIAKKGDTAVGEAAEEEAEGAGEEEDGVGMAGDVGAGLGADAAEGASEDDEGLGEAGFALEDAFGGGGEEEGRRIEP